MSVYVDNARLPFGRMLMCHMIADSTEELLEMADEIGVRRKWIQKAGTGGEHFDISLGKRAAAIAVGAVEISERELGRMVRDRRIAAGERVWRGS